MHNTTPRNRWVALMLGVATLVLSAFAAADPPTRVARLGYMAGAVSFSPAGEDNWVEAAVNRPLVTGDRLWADADGRAELQLGGAVIRLGSSTSLSLLNVDDRSAQIEITQGTLNVHVHRLAPTETIEIDTPNLAFTVSKPGDFRIDVDPAGNATIVTARSGQADVYGEGAAYSVRAGQAYQFSGTGLRDYTTVAMPRGDDFDRWSSERNGRAERSASARYVSPYVIGYEDLDTYGTWQNTPGYGYVWAPRHVAAGWVPYREGHWTWIEPWGWTWVDDAPWGFTVSHYGRWAYFTNRWYWVPGPVAARPVYAPALVAFVGGDNFQLAISGGNVGGVGWFPLGPREVYRPAYAASRNYFDAVNMTNTRVDRATIGRVYANPSAANITYVNRRVPGAVVAVPTTAFAQGQSVARAAVHIPRERVERAPVIAVAAVPPTRASLVGERKPARNPPAAVLERPVVARTAPPPRPAAFERREQLLARNPGRPLDATAMREAAPPQALRADKIHIVKPTKAPTAVPPVQQAPIEARGKGEQRPPRGEAAAPSAAVAPPVSVAPGRMAERAPKAPVAVEPPVTAAPSVAHPAVRDQPRLDKHPRPDRERAAAAAPPPEAAAQPQAAMPPPVQRHKPEPRPKPEHAAPPPQAAAAAAPPPQAAMPPPPPIQRHKPEPRPKPEHAAPPPQAAAAAAPPPQAAMPPPPVQRHKPEPRPKPEHAAPPPQAAAVAPAAPVAAPAGPAPKPEGGKQHEKPAGEGKPEGDKHKK